MGAQIAGCTCSICCHLCTACLTATLLTMAVRALLPLQSRVHPRTQTPVVSVVFCGLVSAVLALFVPIGDLADLTSLGALFAFCVVCLAVIFR